MAINAPTSVEEEISYYLSQIEQQDFYCMYLAYVNALLYYLKRSKKTHKPLTVKFIHERFNIEVLDRDLIQQLEKIKIHLYEYVYSQ